MNYKEDLKELLLENKEILHEIIKEYLSENLKISHFEYQNKSIDITLYLEDLEISLSEAD